MLYSQNLLQIFNRMLKVAEFLQCVPFENGKITGVNPIIQVSSGRKLKTFKSGLTWVTLQVFSMVFQLYQHWNEISIVAKIESVFFICVISFGVVLQLALYPEKNLFVAMIREMDNFERRNNRRLNIIKSYFLKIITSNFI